MTAPIPPSPDVAWHEARTEGRATARGLGNLILAWLIIGAALVCYVTGGWAAVGCLVVLWGACWVGGRRWSR